MRGRLASVRAQSGLDRLALFLLVILLVLLVTPTVLGFAGLDVRETPEEERPPELTVVGMEGTAIDGNRTSIGAIRVTVTNTGGGEIDPREMSATLVSNGTEDLVAAGSDVPADGTFLVEGTGDSDEPALDAHTDRAVLVFDVGTDDVEGADEVGDRLAAGETATLTIVTGEGASVRLVVSPPTVLPDGGSVAL